MLILNWRHLRLLGKCPKSAVTCAFLRSLRFAPVCPGARISIVLPSRY
jgi:hypothetical protein